MKHNLVPSLADVEHFLQVPEARELSTAAHQARNSMTRRDLVTYSIDPIINYTNVCTAYCSFCSFYRAPGARDGYVLSQDQIDEKIEASIRLGATGILLQGGLNPALGLGWYQDTLLHIKKTFNLHLQHRKILV